MSARVGTGARGYARASSGSSTVPVVTGDSATELKHLEDRFRRAGLPLFIAGRSAATDVFNRAVPFMGLVFLVEIMGALNLDWSIAANIAAVLAALALMLAGIAAVNRSRGRAAAAIPEDIGSLELAAFILVPAVLPAVFGGQWVSALVTGVANALLLVAVLGIVGFGLASILRWTLKRLVGQVRASLGLFARAIPLLMLFAVVLFVNTEMWQVFADLGLVSMLILISLFVVLGSSFLVARLPREVLDLEREASQDAPPLDRSERANVGLVMFVSQSLQVLTVALAVGAFFVAIGMLIIDAEVMRAWIQTDGEVVVDFTVAGEVPLYLTAELVKVAGAIAAFTGLYFAISIMTDDVYRREFLEELSAEMRSSFRDRAEYLHFRTSANA